MTFWRATQKHWQSMRRSTAESMVPPAVQEEVAMHSFQLTAGGGSLQALAAAVPGIQGIAFVLPSWLRPFPISEGLGSLRSFPDNAVDGRKTPDSPSWTDDVGASWLATAATVALLMSLVPDGERSCRWDLERPKANRSAAGS